jgi:hypothetical protein
LQLYGVPAWKEDSCPSTVNFFFTTEGGLKAISIALARSSSVDMQACASRWLTDLGNSYGGPAYKSEKRLSNGLMLSAVEVWRTRNGDVSLNRMSVPATGPLSSVSIDYRPPGFFTLPKLDHSVR